MASSRSNEEIIENLTKDLRSSHLNEANVVGSHSTESHDDIQSDVHDTASGTDSCASESSKSHIDSEKVDDAEFIDEDSLKDRDTLLTEEQIDVGFLLKIHLRF